MCCVDKIDSVEFFFSLAVIVKSARAKISVNSKFMYMWNYLYTLACIGERKAKLDKAEQKK